VSVERAKEQLELAEDPSFRRYLVVPE